ncbi:MAG: hypothetical protein CMJ31_01680 [Phycisphaerae bacterium]|nr:hypothetical protein [Phycisphaerae bacterium]
MTPSHAARYICAALLTASCGLPVAVAGQAVQPAQTAQAIAPAELFRLPIDPTSGPLRFSARRGWTWREPAGSAPPTTRLLLDGEVRLVLADVDVKADRAALWIAREPDAAGADRYHVFILAENVRTPNTDPALGVSAAELPIAGVVIPSGPIELRVDARFDRPPEGRELVEFLNKAKIRVDDMRSGRPLRPQPRMNDLTPIRPADLTDLPLGSRPTAQPPAEPRNEPVDEPTDTAPPPVVTPVPRAPSPQPAPPETRETPTPSTPTSDPTPAPSGSEQSERPSAQTPPAATPSPAAAPADVSPETTERPAVAAAPIDDADEIPEARPIFAADGVFYVGAGETVIVESGEQANTATLMGGVTIQYQSADGQLELVASRGVVFLQPGPLRQSLGRLGADEVRGVYLEGGVRVTDGDYTMRAEQVYYDVQANRAIALDTVFWTYEQRIGMPLYMRADVVRQEAADEFNAETARFSNTAFFRPHLAIGARDLTIVRREDEAGDTRSIIDARGVTLRAGPAPFFWFPRFKGDPERVPLRNIGFSDSNRQGFTVQTEWDPFVLLGIERPDGIDAALDIDYYGERGVGLGARAEWDRGRHSGDATAYFLPDDQGSDISVSGSEINRDGEARGIFVGRDFWSLTPEWTLISEIGHVSDPLLTQDLFRDLGRDGDDVNSRLHLRRLEDNTRLSIEAAATLNDFVVNQHRLQAPGYNVDKLPEIELDVIADDLSPFLPPGLVTHTWEASYTNARIRLSEVDAAEQGFLFPEQSQRVFGGDPEDSSGDVLRALGYDESFINRFDTRHEFTSVLDLGPVRATPFAVGRFTAYDDDFEAFSPNEDDNVRLWGAAGVRLSTSLVRVDDSVESRTFDLHRIRHIIEPSLTLWHAETTVQARDLPVYDDDVEQLGEGSAIRLAVDQTWQTKRGGPGRWRSVDVFKLNFEYAWAADDTERGTPIARWYDARPELGAPQTYARSAFEWQVSEIVGLAGELIYDPDISSPSRESIGVRLTPGRGFDAIVGFRRLEAQDATYLDTSVGYLFADKYQVRAGTQYNFVAEDFQDVRAVVLRDFPVGQFGVSISYNNITNETSFGVVLRPFGQGTGLGFGGDTTSSRRSLGFGG